MARTRERGLFFHGRKSGIGATAVRVTGRTKFSFQTGAILIKAAASNTGKIYVGSTPDVTADSNDLTDGFELSAGDSVVVEIDDPSKVFAIASVADQKVFWIGM